MPFLMDEDDALKEKLTNYGKGYSVLNYGTATQTPITVYFRFPDTEIVAERTYPYIAIDLAEINFDPTRAHRAMEFIFNYDTETATPLTGFSQVAYDYPLPFSLVYQLACYSTQPRHDRQMASLLYQLFPAGFGSLNMANYDGTIRRADFVSSVRRDTINPQSKKRLYRNIFTIAVSSEFFLGEIEEIQHTNQTVSVNLDVVLNQPVAV